MIKNATIVDSSVSSGDDDVYEDTSDNFEVSFFSVPYYSNGKVQGIQIQVKALRNYQGQLTVQAGFDG